MIATLLGQAWHAMGANKLRTFLTMLGMVIGVFAVVLMMAIGQGAQQAVKTSIESMGSNLFIVFSGSSTSSGARMGSGAAPTLTVVDADAIAELSGAQIVAPVQPGTAQVLYGSNNWSTSVIGTTPSYLDVRSWPVVEGLAFTEADLRSAARVVLLGRKVADTLFGDEDPVGKIIRVRNIPFVVAGVLGTKGQSLDGRDQDDTIVMPLTTAQRKVFGTPFQGSVRFIYVQTASAEAMPVVEESINTLLRQRHRLREGQDDDFSVLNLTAMANSAAEIARIMALLLGAIASISLLVGGIGIMNIMLVSVTERTREIGVRKALGATRWNILFQFLTEAVVLCLLGGLIGILLGGGVATWLSSAFEWNTQISAMSIVLAFGFSAVIGVVFGVWPARRAAQLDPISALRYE